MNVISAGEKPDLDHNPPIMNHNSRGRSTSACNCGRKQAPRDDPFDIQAANHDFYQVRIYAADQFNLFLDIYAADRPDRKWSPFPV